MAKKNAVLNIIFGADTKELDKALQGVAKRLRSTADDLNGLGQSLSLGLTAPIVAFGALATKNAVDSAKAIAQVEAAVKSTGGAAGKSVADLEAMAEGLQRISLYDDDQILKEVTANLLTFTNVTGTQFDKAQVAILNLSTRLGTDLTSASVQVGKALNDPIKGVTALGRAGVQFTAEQKELITTLTESGDVAGAQAIILGELETQFGGAAEAAANVDPYTQLANEIGNLSEDFGVIINDAIRPLVRYVREAVDAIKGWSDATKTTVLVIGGLLAALGPTLIAVGALINSYTTIKGALIAAKAAQIQMNLATLANPYVAAAAALAVLTLAMLNYKTETELAAEAKAKFDAQLEGKSLEDKYNIVQTELNKTIKQRAVVTDLLAAEQERLRKGTVALSAGAAAATAAEKPLTVEYAKQIEALDRRRDELAKQAQGIRNEIKESKRQTQATNENTTATNKNTTARETALDVFKRETAAYMAQQKAIEDLNAEMNDTLLTLRDLGEGPSVAEALLGKAPEAPFMMNLMDLEMQDELIPEEAIEGADRYVAAFMRARNAAVEFNYAVSQAVEQAAESMAYNFGEMLGTAMATGDGMQGLGRMVLGTLADLAVQVGKIAIGVGISVEGIKKALQSLNPVLAVAAGIALVALGSYARTRLSQSAGGGVPAFAQGGLVTGPTLAMVGDNRSGKEAIIPFERMGEFLQMAGAGQSNANVTVTGRLQGRDLVISNERTTFNRNRTKY
jgi:hypothetical protein